MLHRSRRTRKREGASHGQVSNAPFVWDHPLSSTRRAVSSQPTSLGARALGVRGGRGAGSNVACAAGRRGSANRLGYRSARVRERQRASVNGEPSTGGIATGARGRCRPRSHHHRNLAGLDETTPFFWTFTTAVRVFSGSSPGEPLEELAAEVSPATLLLIASRNAQRERVQPALRRGCAPAERAERQRDVGASSATTMRWPRSSSGSDRRWP